MKIQKKLMLSHILWLCKIFASFNKSNDALGKNN